MEQQALLLDSQPSTLNPQLSVLYGRVSTGQQATSTQEIRGKEYLQWKRLPLAAEFYDDDVSGSVAIWERPNGRLLRQRLEAGDIRHLVVLKLDRLGRSAIDLLNTIQFLDARRIVLHIVDMGGDSLSTQGASGRLMFTVLAGMAEYERELIRSRIQDKLNVKRAHGELTGTEPYGFTAVLTGETSPKGVPIKQLVDNPEEQAWLLEMRRLRLAGYGYHRIAKWLNDRNVPTKRRGEVLRLLNGSRRKLTDADKRFTSGRWQAGNVASVLNSKPVREWFATQPQAQAA